VSLCPPPGCLCPIHGLRAVAIGLAKGIERIEAAFKLAIRICLPDLRQNIIAVVQEAGERLTEGGEGERLHIDRVMDERTQEWTIETYPVKTDEIGLAVNPRLERCAETLLIKKVICHVLVIKIAADGEAKRGRMLAPANGLKGPSSGSDRDTTRTRAPEPMPSHVLTAVETVLSRAERFDIKDNDILTCEHTRPF